MQERPLTDIVEFLGDDARAAEALALPGWRREERDPLWLADFEITLSSLIHQIMTRGEPLYWPTHAHRLNTRDITVHVITATWNDRSIYGSGGWNRFHVQSDGSIKMSASHTGSGWGQSDRAVLLALWLGMPVYGVWFRDGMDHARLVLMEEVENRQSEVL